MQALTDKFKSRIGASRIPTWNDAFDAVTNLPAAEVKPVVYAHWYINDGCAYCSNCRNNFKKAILNEVMYCPRCGALLKGYGGDPT